MLYAPIIGLATIPFRELILTTLPFRLEQHRRERFRDAVRSIHVDVEDEVEVLLFDFDHRGDDDNAGVVDYAVQSAPRFADQRHGGGDVAADVTSKRTPCTFLIALSSSRSFCARAPA